MRSRLSGTWFGSIHRVPGYARIVPGGDPFRDARCPLKAHIPASVIGNSNREEDAESLAVKSRAAVVLVLGVIAAATLTPVSVPEGGVLPPGRTLCVLCGARGLADFILNIGLYAPLGMALAARGWRWIGVVGAGMLLSVTIEALQVFIIPGRDASVGDLISNTMGAGIGWGLWWGWVRRRALGRTATAALPSAAVIVVVALLMAGLRLLTPSFPAALYYLQWTADLGNLEVYEGEVLSTRVGPLDLPGPPGPMERSDSIRALLRDGATLETTIRAGPPPAGLAPIFSIYDHRQREIILLGADGQDLVYRHRSNAAEIRLDGAEIRFQDALADVAAGEVVTLSVSPDTAGPAPGTRGYRASVDSRVVRSPGFTAGRTWTLLFYRPGWGVGLSRILDLVWLAALFLPAGLLGSRLRDCGPAALLAVAGLLVVPPLLGFPTTSVAGTLAALGGVAAGYAVARLSRTPASGGPAPVRSIASHADQQE